MSASSWSNGTVSEVTATCKPSPGDAINEETVTKHAASVERRFVDPSSHGIKHRAARGGAVALASQAVKLALRTGSIMVLARLLTPNEFGIVAMASMFTGLLNMFKDAGLSAAAVQQEIISHEQMSALFWVNLAVGSLLAMVTAVAAPVLASFYQQPELISITLWLSLTFLLAGAAVQHQAILQRNMSFVVLAVIEVVALLSSVVTGIAMALLHAGLWSLVGMALALPLASSIGFWFATGWIPDPPRRVSGVRSLLKFGGTFTINTFIIYIAYNLDKVLLGKFWGADSLGIYGRAYQLINIPTENLNSSIGGVAFPALARVQNDPIRLKTYFLKGYTVFLSLVIPITFSCALTSDDIVTVFLGDAWNEAVPIFRLLAPTILAFAMINPFAWLMVSTGQVVRSLKIACMITPTVILGYVLGLQAGPEGVAAGFSIAMLLIIVPMILWAKHGTLISMGDVAIAIARPLTSVLIASGATWFVMPHLAFIQSTLLRLTLANAVLFGIYLLVLLIVFAQKRIYWDLLHDAGIWPPKSKLEAAKT